MRIVFIPCIASLFVWVAGCTGGATACTEDGDCAAGQTCVDGTCTGGPAEGEGEGEGEGDAGEGEGEGEGDAQVCDANSTVCDSDRVCAGGFCDKTNDGDDVDAAGDPLGCCVKLVCAADTDCRSDERCDVTRGVCLPNDTCDPGVASTTCPLCSYTDDAPSCLADVTAPDACELTSAGAAIVEGGHAPLEALALKGGKPTAYVTFTFTAQITGGGGIVGEGALDVDGAFTGCTGPDPCDVTVTATSVPAGAVCTGALTVFAPPTAGNTRVVLLDAKTRAPLVGAPVEARTGATFTTVVTDARGLAEFVATTADVVTAMPADHDWQSVLAPPPDVVLYTHASRDPANVTGKKGSFDLSRVRSFGDISIAIAGLSLPSLADLQLERVLGVVEPYNVEIEGITDPGGQLVPFPSSEQWTLGVSPIKADFVAFGDGGLLWSLASKVSLADLGPTLSALGGAEPQSVGTTLVQEAALFGAPDHAFDDVVADTGARPPAPPADTATSFVAWPFTATTTQPSTFAYLDSLFTLNPNPATPDVVAAAVVRVPGRGYVPLGVTGILNVDDAGTPHTLGYAPPHDGLEGQPVTFAIAALDSASLVDGRGAGVTVSATFANPPVRPSLATVTGTYDNVAGSFTSTDVLGADAYRAQLEGPDGLLIVWSSTAATFTIADLTDVALTNRADSARAEALDLDDLTTFATLLSADGADARDIDLHLKRLSSTPCLLGGVSCTAP